MARTLGAIILAIPLLLALVAAGYFGMFRVAFSPLYTAYDCFIAFSIFSVLLCAFVIVLVQVPALHRALRVPRMHERLQLDTKRRTLGMPTAWWCVACVLGTWPAAKGIEWMQFHTLGRTGTSVGQWSSTLERSYIRTGPRTWGHWPSGGPAVNFRTMTDLVPWLPFGLQLPWATLGLSVAIDRRDGNGPVPVEPGTSFKNVMEEIPAVAIRDGLGLPYGTEVFFGGLDQIMVGKNSAFVWSAVRYDLCALLAYAMPMTLGVATVRMLTTTRRERRAIRLAQGMCPACRYVVGLPADARCPECGRLPSGQCREPPSPIATANP